MTELPKLNVICYRFEPCKESDKLPCPNCRVKFIILNHAAAYKKNLQIKEKVIEANISTISDWLYAHYPESNWTRSFREKIAAEIWEYQMWYARDAVLDLLPKEVKP